MPVGFTPTQNRLRDDVHGLVDSGGNVGRMNYVTSTLDREQISFKKYSIGWWTPYYNIVTNENPRKKDVMFVCHYDKTDNLTLVFRQWTHGLLDPILPCFADGGWDNGGGVAVGLELARRGYCVAFVGLEESGLIGSRALVADLPLPLPREVHCIDQVGAAKPVRGLAPWPLGGSDHVPFQHTSFATEIVNGALFNGPFGLIPRKTWFVCRGTKGYWMTSLPDGGGADFAIVTVSFLAAGPTLGASLPLSMFSRYQGIWDRAGVLKPWYLEDAVILAEKWASD